MSSIYPLIRIFKLRNDINILSSSTQKRTKDLFAIQARICFTTNYFVQEGSHYRQGNTKFTKY